MPTGIVENESAPVTDSLSNFCEWVCLLNLIVHKYEFQSPSVPDIPESANLHFVVTRSEVWPAGHR